VTPPVIDPANTWVVSDTHFGHQNIVGFCHRPLDHEQVMIAEWRAHVPDDATVLHLGDLCYKSNAQFKHILAPELTGARKLLILGNHDRQRFSFYRDCGFKIVKPFSIEYVPVAPSGTEVPWHVSFSHYPLKEPRDWDVLFRVPRAVHIHGHIHNNGYGGKDSSFTPFSAGQINLSVEQTHYRPVNLKSLLDGYIQGCYEQARSEA
jgi:calcineurin-like phosphoesterase family protein